MEVSNTKLLNDLYKAYFQALKGKRFKANTRGFSYNWEINVLALYHEIMNKTYIIRPSLCFISNYPVKREIFAGDFRDRIVHHLLFNYLNVLCEPLFINDAYSCRKGKGTLYGINRVSRFMRACSDNYSQTAYSLKLDIKGYFMSIDRNILYQQVQKIMSSFKAKRVFDLELINIILFLSKEIIFNDPTMCCNLRGNKDNWQELPKDKSLFFTKKEKGLPIGNLTSQLFGNLYLKDFDNFIKKDLKCKYYGRYVDDMVFVSKDKKYLISLIDKINNYLQINLNLRLHPNKMYLQEINKGLPFLGVIIKPYRLYINKRLRISLYKILSDYGPQFQQSIQLETGYISKLLINTDYSLIINSRLNSIWGISMHHDSYLWRQKVNLNKKLFILTFKNNLLRYYPKLVFQNFDNI